MNETVETIRYALMGVCLSALAAIGLFALFCWLKRFCGEQIGRFLAEFRRDKGVLITLPLIVCAVMYGGSKGTGGPAFRPDATADSGIGFVGLVTETNSVPDTVVSVYYVSGEVTAETPVSVRNLQTDAWTELVKSDCQYDTFGTTNVFRFVTSGINWLNAAYWHVGSSKPPIVVTSSDINIEYVITSANYVKIKWNCTDANCTQFSVMTSEDGVSWNLAGTTSNTEYEVLGFLVGKTRWWKVTSFYFKESEDL